MREQTKLIPGIWKGDDYSRSWITSEEGVRGAVFNPQNNLWLINKSVAEFAADGTYEFLHEKQKYRFCRFVFLEEKMSRRLAILKLTVTIIFIFCGNLLAQKPIPGLFSTGVNNDRIAQTPGSLESHYSMENSQTPQVVARHSLWVQPPAGSAWISLAGGNQSLPIATYVYKLTFDLSGFDPRTAKISGQAASDNNLTILINGIDTGFSNLSEPFQRLHPFSINTGFMAGMNILEFRVLNFAVGPSGLLVANISGEACENAEDCGLVAYYPFDGNANDESGNGNHGALNGTTPPQLTMDRFGNPQQAYLFNGSTAYIEAPNSPSLQSPTQAITIAAWINVRDWYRNSAGGFIPIIHKSNDPIWRQYAINIRMNLEWSFIEACHSQAPVGNTNPVLNKWTFVALTFDEETDSLKFYLDGIPVRTKFCPADIPAPDTKPLLIGLDVPGATEYLNGSMDDLRIYNRALSPDEILQLYHEGGWPNGRDLVSLANGSFESATVNPGSFIMLPNGSTAINSWTVTSGTIDYIGTLWIASDSSRSIDLNGTTPGSISQSFRTLKGSVYHVQFDMAGNPDCGVSTKRLRISAAGSSREFDFSTGGNGRQNMGWQEKAFEFIAIDTLTTLTFTSLVSGACGPALDNVRISRPGEDIVPPAIPQALRANAGQNQVTLIWNPNTDRDLLRYRIYRSTNYPTFRLHNSVAATTTTFVDAGLDPNVIYFYRITAMDSALNESGYSNEVSSFVPTLPDLEVTRVQAPPNASSGQSIQINWIVTNNGNDGTKAPVWFDDVFLSPTQTFDPQTAIRLGQFENFSALNAGEAYANSATFTLPRGISGARYVFVRTDISNHERESNEGNNQRASDPMQVALSPFPDLQVIAVAAPNNAFSGDSVQVSWTVQNNQTGRTEAEQWFDTIFLSDDDTLDFDFIGGSGIRINETALGVFGHRGALEPGASYTAAAQIKLPHAIMGKHTIFVYTDINGGQTQSEAGLVYEYDFELNNLDSTAIQITLSPAPDLEVEDVTAPAIANPGEDVVVQWRVINHGPGAPFENSWQDRVYLSRTPAFNPDSAVVLGAFTRNGSLELDSSYATSRTVRIPNGFAGVNYIFVHTDWNNGVFEYQADGNNISSPGRPILINNPDFAMGPIAIPSTANSGKNFEIVWSVINNGPGAVFNMFWNDRVYLTRLPVFNPDSATVLGMFSRSGVLRKDSSYTVTRSFTLSNGVSGDYYVFVETDAGNLVFENQNEGNNRGRSPNAMRVQLSPWADLQVDSITTPDSLMAGGRLAVTWTAANRGVAAAEGTWIDRVYLSSGTEWNPNNATLLASAERTRGLAAGATYTQSRNVTLPTNLSGTYLVTVQTDANNNVYEHTDEGNNLTHSRPIAVAAYPPSDLAVSGLVAPDSALSGSAIKVQWSVKNIGAATTLASGWNDQLYFSTDTQPDPSRDLRMATVVRSGALRSNENYTRQSNLTLANGFFGDYYLIVVSDAGGVANDADRNNNVIVSAKRIHIDLAPSPDLTITSLRLPNQVNAGQPLLLTYTVANRGNGGLSNRNWYDAVYLSQNATLDNADVALAAQPRSLLLLPNSTYTDSVEVEMPSFAAGTYFLIAKTDSRNDIYEHNAELNNAAVGNTTSTGDTTGIDPIDVDQPAPADLIVSDVTIPANAIPGEEVTISWTLQNIGENRATGRLRDAVYISADTLFQVEDPVFGVLTHNIDLPPDSSMQLSMKVNLAKLFRADAEGNLTEELPGLTPGKYHAIVRTDIRRNIRESNTANNTLASVEVMNTDVPELKLGVPVTGTLAAGEKRYYKLESREIGATIQIDLQSSISTASNELYVAFERTPTVNDFDFAAIAPQESNQRAVIPSSQSGEYFILLNSRSRIGLNAGFSLRADSLMFAIHSVDSKVGGNTGQVTVQLLGAKFDSSMTVSLMKGSSTISAHEILFVDQTKAFASFNLKGAELGFYDLSIQNQSGRTASLSNGFEVVPGTEELLITNIKFPSAARNGQTVTMEIEFKNEGNIDIARSGSILVSLSGTPMGYLPSYLKYRFHSLYIDYREPRGPRDFLRPGVRGSTTVFAKAEEEMRFELFRPVVNLVSNESMQNMLAAKIHPNELTNGGVQNWSDDCTLVPDFCFSESCIIHDACYDQCGTDKLTCDLLFLNTMVFQCFTKDPSRLEFNLCYEIALIYFAGVVVFGGSYFDAAQEVACMKGGGPLPEYPPVDLLPLIPRDRPCAPGSKCWEIPVQRAIDPNDITGPTGFGDEHWITATQTLPYTIRFENDSTRATAAAQVVSITQKLDSTLDSRSFRLGSFGFANQTFTVPENRAFYSERLDVRDSLGVFVDVTAGIDITTSEAFWIFRAIDPATGQLPVFNGFLPVNDAQHRGEGFANYTIRPKREAKTGDVVQAQARIIFDTNEPIDTPEIFNTIDAVIPTSRVAALPATINTTTFTLRWSGQDDATGSKIHSYALYVSENNQAFKLFESELADTSLVFSGDPGNTYRFFILAADNAGNIEPLKVAAEATVMIDPNATAVAGNRSALPKAFALYQNYPNPFNPTTIIKYDLPVPSEVKLEIFDILGRRVRVLVDTKQQAGFHNALWDGKTAAGRSVATGVYFYRIEAKEFVKTRKMLLVR